MMIDAIWWLIVFHLIYSFIFYHWHLSSSSEEINLSHSELLWKLEWSVLGAGQRRTLLCERSSQTWRINCIWRRVQRMGWCELLGETGWHPKGCMLASSNKWCSEEITTVWETSLSLAYKNPNTFWISSETIGKWNYLGTVQIVNTPPFWQESREWDLTWDLNWTTCRSEIQCVWSVEGWVYIEWYWKLLEYNIMKKERKFTFLFWMYL